MNTRYDLCYMTDGDILIFHDQYPTLNEAIGAAKSRGFSRYRVYKVQQEIVIDTTS